MEGGEAAAAEDTAVAFPVPMVITRVVEALEGRRVEAGRAVRVELAPIRAFPPPLAQTKVAGAARFTAKAVRDSGSVKLPGKVPPLMALYRPHGSPVDSVTVT